MWDNLDDLKNGLLKFLYFSIVGLCIYLLVLIWIEMSKG